MHTTHTGRAPLMSYDNKGEKVTADFLSPLFIRSSLGMDYTVSWVNKKLTGHIQLSPIAYNFRYVDRLALSKKNGIEDSLNAADQLAEFHEVRNREYFFQALAEKTILLGEKDVDELQGKNKANKGGWRKLVPFLGRGKEEKKPTEKRQELFVVTKDFNRKKPIYISDNISLSIAVTLSLAMMSWDSSMASTR